MTTPRRTSRPPIVVVANSYRNRMLPRYKTDLRVRIAVADPIPRLLYARTADLSTGGVSVVVPQQFGDGVVVAIALRSPNDSKPVWFRARLRHRSGFRCGFQFIETTVQQRAMIRLLCSSAD